MCNCCRGGLGMTQITIDIANWGRVDDKELLRVVRNAINYHIKYGFPNKTINVWQDQEQHVEMNIKIK